MRTVIDTVLEVDQKTLEEKIESLTFLKMVKIIMRLILKNAKWTTYLSFILVPVIIIFCSNIWLTAIVITWALMMEHIDGVVFGMRMALNGKMVDEILRD